MDNRKQSSILKQKVRVPLQEVLLPDIPDDDTVTTTVTRSRRVSFGTNFIKEFIVGSAATTQCVSEYEHVLSSSDSSRSATASHIFEQSTFSAQENVRLSMEAQALNLSMNKSHSENASDNRYEFEVDKKQLNVLKQSKNLGDLHLGPEKVVSKNEDLNRSNNPEKRTKCGKFSSTICFSADSPTADMEFTEGCINLAKSILDKKKKAITVFIQAKETKPEGNETFVFETSDAEMSITKCMEPVGDGDGDSSQEKINKSMMDVDDFTDSDMEETDVGAPFLPSGKNFTEETDGGILEDAFRLGMDPDVEKCLFSPQKKLSDVLNFPGDDSMDENMSLDDSRIEFDLKNEGEHTYYPQSEVMEFTKCVVPQELIVEQDLETLAVHKEYSMNMSACEPVMMEETPCKKIPLNKSHISFVDSESSDDGDSMDVTGCLNVPSEPDVNKLFSLPAEKEKNDSLDDLTESVKRDSVDSFVGGLFTGENNNNNKNDGDGDFEAEDLSEDPLATPLETSLDNKKSFEDSGMDLTVGISREISVEKVDVCGDEVLDEFEEEKENRDPLLIIPEGINSFRESPVRDDGEEEDILNLSDREMDVSTGKGILDDISHVSIPEKVPVKVMPPMTLIPDDVSTSTGEEDIDEGKMGISPEKLILDDDSHVSIPPPEKKTEDESSEKSFEASLPEIPEKILREGERSRILTIAEFPTAGSPENPVERSRILENSVRKSPEKSVREERLGILQISVLGDPEKSVSEEKSRNTEKSCLESPEKIFMETRTPQKPETETSQEPKTETPRKPETPRRPETPGKPETKTPQKPEAESSRKPKRETPRKPETPRRPETKTPQKPEAETPQKMETETPQKMESKTPQKMETESPRKMETETRILQRSVLESPGEFPRSERSGILRKSLLEIPEKSLINEQRNALHEINFESPEKLVAENERSRISEESALDNPEKSVREQHSRISIPEVVKVFSATPEKFERSAILTAEEKRNPEKIVESKFETPEKSIPEERNLISPSESLNMSLGLENLNVSPDKAKLTVSFTDSNPQKTPPGKFDVLKEAESKEDRSALNPDFEKSVSQLIDSALEPNERSGMDLDVEKVPEPKDNSRSLININSNTIILHNETPIIDRTGVTFTVTPKNSTYVVPNHTYVLEEEEKKEGEEREILQSPDEISPQKPENRTPAKETPEKQEDPEVAGTETLQKPETPRRIEMETPEKPETETPRTPETKTPQKQDTETPQKMETETPPKSENKTASNRSPRNAQRLQFPAKDSVKRLSVELSPLPENQHKKHRLSSDFAETGIRLVTDVSFDEMDEVTLNEIEENKESTVTTTNVTTESHLHLPPPPVSPTPTPSPPPADDEKMEIDTKSFTDFTIGDSKIMTSLTEQAKETNCLWKIRQLGNSNSWIFTFDILRSTAVLEFKIKPSNEADSYSLVSDCQISLTHDDKYLTDADLTVIEFGFFKLEKFFRDQRKIQNVRQISYFLDIFNSCSSKLNGHLKQILSILEGYPGSSLKNEALSFRLFSFPVLFSSDVIVDLKNLSRLSISFERHFGDLNENEIRNIFDESMKCENPLVDFIISSTKYIIRLELELGRISKRDHIGLLPEYLKKL